MSDLADQALLNEAAQPELSEDTFTINGRVVKITPLRLKYHHRFLEVFEPIANSVALAMEFLEENPDLEALKTSLDFCRLALGFISNVEPAAELIQVLCHNDGYLITEEELGESTLTLEEMQCILLQSYRKGGRDPT